MDNPASIYFLIMPAYAVLAVLTALAGLAFGTRKKHLWGLLLSIPTFVAGNFLFWVFLWLLSLFESADSNAGASSSFEVIFTLSLIAWNLLLLTSSFVVPYKLGAVSAALLNLGSKKEEPNSEA